MMESKEQGLMARSVINGFVKGLIILVMMTLCQGCTRDDKPGVFDIVLDTYVSYHELNGEEHYIEVSANEEMIKDQVILSVEYRYVDVDELRLPEVYLEGECQGIKVYCRFSKSRKRFPVDHNMTLKRVNNTREYEWKATNEYFNNITLNYDRKNKKIVTVSKGFPPDTLMINHFKGVFMDRGIWGEL